MSNAPVIFSVRQTVVPVTAANTAVIAQNASRKHLSIQNTGTANVTLGFDAAAVASTGWSLAASGGAIKFDTPGVPLSAITAITATGTTTLAVLEGF